MLLFAGVAVVALIFLSSGLAELEFAPGRPLPSLESDGVTLTEKSPSENGIIGIALALFNLVRLLLPLSIIYFIVSPEARKQVLRSLVLLSPLFLFLLLIYTQPDFFQQLQVEPQTPDAPSPSATAAPIEDFIANSPRWLVFLATLGLALLTAAALVGAIWLIWRRLQRPERPLERLAREAQQALDALQSGADLKDTIMRCYFEMSQVLSERRGIRREQAMTTREFERHLEEAGLPGEYVQQLTRLFEGVRYGTRVPDEGQERLARVCLAAVVGFCESSS
jgi:hypothetical protein